MSSASTGNGRSAWSSRCVASAWARAMTWDGVARRPVSHVRYDSGDTPSRAANAASTNDATTSMTIEVPSCTILVDGNSHVNPADGQSGFLAAGGTGRLSFRKGDHEACPIPGMANFTTDPAADWITASGFGTLSDPVYTHYIEYTVAENTTNEARTTSIGTPYPSWIWSRFIPVGQAGVRRPAVVQTCPTTAITYTRTSWTVGGRYYGSRFTQPWAKMGYGEAGGCRASGLSLSQPGRVQGQRPVALSARARADLRLQRG